MNKKRLSVVMAGAMLASSVAPVLAAETSVNEVSQGRIGLLIDRLEGLMDSKKFDVNDRKLNANGSDAGVSQFAGKSVYAIQILENGKTPVSSLTTRTDLTINVSKDASKVKNINLYSNLKTKDALKELVAKDLSGTVKFYTVKVYELGNTTDSEGRIVSTGVNAKDDVTIVNYEKAEFDKLVADVATFESIDASNPLSGKTFQINGLKNALINGWVTGLSLSEDGKEVTVALGSKENGNFKELKCAIGTPELKFDRPVDSLGNLITGKTNEFIQANIANFEFKSTTGATAGSIVDLSGRDAKVAHEVKIVNGDVNYTVSVDELYDGFMLTSKGHELMNAVREFEAKDKKFAPNNTNGIDKNGTERSFTLTFNVKGTKHVVKVVGDSLHEGRIKTLKTWLWNKKANVELLAGSNRYATAVEIAKTYLVSNNQYAKKDCTDLILINGKALVDGLAAAPYAKAKEAPILLTAEDKLPKETKAYMKELIANKYINNLDNDKITVTIVGGEAVVSQNVVNELKEIGFKVKRISGDNREETSLAVADKLLELNTVSNPVTNEQAFVVGAEGEADAMSIAAYAASEKAPIIVAKSSKGLSTVGINEVSEYQNVEIVGGEGVVPKSTEEAIVELLDKDHVTRINGKNRQETNALVIREHHANFVDVLMAKDGQRNKEELIDALPAALFASDTKGKVAPIVLATDKISEEQLNQLVLKANKNANGTAYQIGEGVAESVMHKVVSRLGLNN